MTDTSIPYSDLMGISEQRIMLLDPRDGNPRAEKPVAETECEITFADEESLQKCVAALRESDEELKKRPDAMKLWEWDKTYRLGMKIIFGVIWYDKDFFDSRRDAYRSSSHVGYYKKFGASPDDFKVTHFVFGK